MEYNVWDLLWLAWPWYHVPNRYQSRAPSSARKGLPVSRSWPSSSKIFTHQGGLCILWASQRPGFVLILWACSSFEGWNCWMYHFRGCPRHGCSQWPLLWWWVGRLPWKSVFCWQQGYWGGSWHFFWCLPSRDDRRWSNHLPLFLVAQEWPCSITWSIAATSGHQLLKISTKNGSRTFQTEGLPCIPPPSGRRGINSIRPQQSGSSSVVNAWWLNSLPPAQESGSREVSHLWAFDII